MFSFEKKYFNFIEFLNYEDPSSTFKYISMFKHINQLREKRILVKSEQNCGLSTSMYSFFTWLMLLPNDTKFVYINSDFQHLKNSIGYFVDIIKKSEPMFSFNYTNNANGLISNKNGHKNEILFYKPNSLSFNSIVKNNNIEILYFEHLKIKDKEHLKKLDNILEYKDNFKQLIVNYSSSSDKTSIEEFENKYKKEFTNNIINITK